MNTFPVRFRTSDDLFSDDFICGVLTIDHAAASYGMPVFVGDDGVARGPAEVQSRLELNAYPCTEEYRQWDSCESHAADNVSLDIPHSPTCFSGNKYLPGLRELLDSARLAGYDVESV